MIIEWKGLLAQNNIPEEQWPSNVEEVPSSAVTTSTGTATSATVTRITYPAATPVTVLNPDTGKRQWNPDVKDAIELIYNAYRERCGLLCAPAWNNNANSVRFHAL